MSKEEIDFKMLTADQVAILLDVTIKSVDNYVKQEIDPLPVFHPNNTNRRAFNWLDVLAWYKRRLKGYSTKAKPADDLTQAKLETQNLITQKLQLEIDEKEGTLVLSDDVERVWSSVLIDIKNSLINVGHTCAIDITDNMSYNKKKSIIDTAVFDAVENVINAVEKSEETKETKEIKNVIENVE